MFDGLFHGLHRAVLNSEAPLFTKLSAGYEPKCCFPRVRIFFLCFIINLCIEHIHIYLFIYYLS